MNHRLIGAVLAFVAGLGFASAQAEIATTANHALLMDAESGEVLWQKDAFTPMPPASMSKLMTIELLFQRLKDGRIKLTDTFPVSERAWRERSGSECFVNIGDRMTLVGDIYPGNYEFTVRGIFDSPRSSELMYFSREYLEQTLPERRRGQAGVFTTLIDDPSLRDRMGLLARERVERFFSTDAVVPQYEAFYANVVAASQDGRQHP